MTGTCESVKDKKPWLLLITRVSRIFSFLLPTIHKFKCKLIRWNNRHRFDDKLSAPYRNLTTANNAEAVKALTTIYQLFAEGLSREQVEERLDQLFPHSITVESESQQDRNKQLALLSQGLKPLPVEYTESQKRLALAIEKQTDAFAKLSTRFEENRKQERKRSEKLLRMLREQKVEIE